MNDLTRGAKVRMGRFKPRRFFLRDRKDGKDGKDGEKKDDEGEKRKKEDD